MLLKFYFFRARFFYEKTAKTLCVTIRNFAQFYFVYIYAKIDRFLINERRTYPYIQVVGASRLRRGTFRAPDFTLLHTDFRLFCSIRNFTETARKSRCSPLNRLANQRVSFCRNRRFYMRLCMGYQFCVAVPKIVISAALCLEFPPPRPAVLFRSLAPLFPWFLLPFRTRKT